MNPEQNSQNNTTPPNNSVPPQNNTPKPQDQRMLLGILSYVGILVIVSYILGKDDQVIKFHVKQGLVLLIIEVVLMVVGMFTYMLWPIIGIAHLIVLVLSIIGIVNVVQGKQKELPVVGQFANRFTF